MLQVVTGVAAGLLAGLAGALVALGVVFSLRRLGRAHPRVPSRAPLTHRLMRDV